MKIAVYAIAKNEVAHVARFVESVLEVDHILVVDTGSTDGTLDALRTYSNVTVAQCHLSPFSFDIARNVALSLIPSDVDICVAMDMDEVMLPGWRTALESVWTQGTTRAWYDFIAAEDEHGNPTCTFRRNLAHARNGYRWKWPIHECLMPCAGTVEQTVYVPGMTCVHRPDPSKKRGWYLDRLGAAVQDEPHDARLCFYHARELMYAGMTDASCAEFRRYLTLPGATYLAERGEAFRLLARQTPNAQEKIPLLQQAVMLDPRRRDGWVDLAAAYRVHGQWMLGRFAALQALAITDRMSGFMTYGEAWGAKPYDELSLCLWYDGDEDGARDALRCALEYEPENPRLLENARLMGVTV